MIESLKLKIEDWIAKRESIQKEIESSKPGSFRRERVLSDTMLGHEAEGTRLFLEHAARFALTEAAVDFLRDIATYQITDASHIFYEACRLLAKIGAASKKPDEPHDPEEDTVL